MKKLIMIKGEIVGVWALLGAVVESGKQALTKLIICLIFDQ